jgi:hypothetical protein
LVSQNKGIKSRIDGLAQGKSAIANLCDNDVSGSFLEIAAGGPLSLEVPLFEFFSPVAHQLCARKRLSASRGRFWEQAFYAHQREPVFE